MKVIKRFNIFVHRGCNLNCYFCPEKKVNIGMNENLIGKILNLIKNIFEDGVIIENLKFFGGEPLLNFSFVEKFVLRLYRIFGKDLIKKRIKVMRITTNGWLLNKNMINFFNKYKIRVNVSLNGNKSVYERDRGLYIPNDKWDDFINNIKKLDNIFINFNISPLVVNEGVLKSFKYVYKLTRNINILPVYFINWPKNELKRYFLGLKEILNFVKDKDVYFENYENYSFMPLHNFGINIDVDGKMYCSSIIVEFDKKENKSFLISDYKDILEKDKIEYFKRILDDLVNTKYSDRYLKINFYLDRGLEIFLRELKKIRI